MINDYLKIPIELAEFALRERHVSTAGVYLACQFIYSGKAKIEGATVSAIGTACDLKPRSIYSAFKWLINRRWMGKDSKNGWYFFRGLNHIHQLEGWKYSRAALMFEKDLQTIKAFYIGAFLASLCRSGTGTGSERQGRRSVRNPHPVSLSVIEKALEVSQKSAFSYRKLAKKYRYIEMQQNLKQTTLTINDLRQIRANDVDLMNVPLFGSTQSINAKTEQLIAEKGIVKLQLPNLITPLVLLGKRKVKATIIRV